MPSFDWIIKEVDSGIKALIEKFIQMPYFFYLEQDMQSYLYHKLISGRLGKYFVQTSEIRAYYCIGNIQL
jgi:hypothetical protein|tara:strand:+ start:331 stop:540 length:210 start_codon:yes stop_codon:yes gene_type:complete